jgi:hypothetical protein
MDQDHTHLAPERIHALEARMASLEARLHGVEAMAHSGHNLDGSALSQIASFVKADLALVLTPPPVTAPAPVLDAEPV